MGKKLDKIRLISFTKGKKTQINLIQNTFVDMFNECGKKYDNQAMQLAFTGTIITIFLKNTSIPKTEIKKLLENITQKFK